MTGSESLYVRSKSLYGEVAGRVLAGEAEERGAGTKGDSGGGYLGDGRSFMKLM